MNCHTFYLHYTGTWKICLKFMFVSLIILIDYPQSLTNADILGQGNFDLVREMSGNFAFYNLWEPCLFNQGAHRLTPQFLMFNLKVSLFG